MLLGSSAAWALLATSGPARSQAWPQRRVRIILPFPLGGNSDFMLRLIAERLTQRFGQPFIIESRPGALAAEMVARAEPDGYTLLMGSPSQISITPLITKTAYDPVTGFAPISVIGTNPKVWGVPADLPVATFAEFVDYARKRPGQLAYADAGAGSIAHLSNDRTIGIRGPPQEVTVPEGATAASAAALSAASHACRNVANHFRIARS